MRPSRQNRLLRGSLQQSYNPGKKKHVILYDDGDVEVLQLDKEQWEVISEGSDPSKRMERFG